LGRGNSASVGDSIVLLACHCALAVVTFVAGHGVAGGWAGDAGHGLLDEHLAGGGAGAERFDGRTPALSDSLINPGSRTILTGEGSIIPKLRFDFAFASLSCQGSGGRAGFAGFGNRVNDSGGAAVASVSS